MEILEQKKLLRVEIREKRKKLTGAEIQDCSAKALVRVLGMPEYVCCRSVFTYVSYGQELSTFPLIKAAFLDGKTVAVPKVEGQRMEFFRIVDLSELKKGYRGILEPEGKKEPVCPDQDSLMVLPGMLFDRDGNRMGYGGGFYDKYLDSVKGRDKPVLLGYSYDFQLFEKDRISEKGYFHGRFPAEKHDQTVDIIVTPSETYYVK